MKTYNIDRISPERPTVFVLTYMGIDYFNRWSIDTRSKSDFQFVLVDNGQQNIPSDLTTYPTFQASRNLGCAGGWNLISQIGFRKYGMDKIIFAQDDAMFDEQMLHNIWNESTDTVIGGAYDRAFEFSLFGLTNRFWTEVGMFDENFIYVGCEDNDYKQRAKLSGKTVKCLGYSADMNKSLTSKHITEVAKPANIYNVQYLEEKWGKQCEYVHPFNDSSNAVSDCQIHSGLIDVYGEIDKFPSLYEFTTHE